MCVAVYSNSNLQSAQNLSLKFDSPRKFCFLFQTRHWGVISGWKVALNQQCVYVCARRFVTIYTLQFHKLFIYIYLHSVQNRI